MLAYLFGGEAIPGPDFCRRLVDVRQPLRRKEMIEIRSLGSGIFHKVLTHHISNVLVNARKPRLGGAALGFSVKPLI